MPSEGVRLTVQVRLAGSPGRPPRLDVSLETHAVVTAIMGPSGGGKSTLLQCIAGLLRPDTGHIILEGETLFDTERGIDLPTHRRRVAMVFQSLALLPHMTVWENVAYGIPAKGRRARRDAAMAWLQRARIHSLAHRAPGTLSGGEAQRVALVRALASEPRLLLLDEPFSALNQELRVQLHALLRELLDVIRIPVLLVTHDRVDAERMASRILQLDAGRIVQDATVGS